jgi:CubicO group peptidase (beta-lactamase class C family)
VVRCVQVDGWVAEGLDAVRDAFAQNFRTRNELGAAVAVWRDGAPVVDLWGGYADPEQRRRWKDDTIVLVFSATKGLAATAVAVANSRGLIHYDDPVAAYWPEFAVGGKAEVTIRQLLAHQAGLCALDLKLDATLIANWPRLTGALAEQRPAWAPGTRHGYHHVTLGWYESELIRRVDPERRRLSGFFRDEVAAPLDADFHVGLPNDIDPDRVATVEGWPGWKMLFHMGALPVGMVLAYLWPRSTTARTMGNPRMSSPAQFGSSRYRSLELPAAVGFGTARAIAAIYGDLACGGARLGLNRQTLDLLDEPGRAPTGGTRDLVLHTDTSYSLGWWRPFPAFDFGSPAAFGAPGMGGSFGYADPDVGIGFAYVTNRMGFHVWDDPRDLALRTALRQCIRSTPGPSAPT